MTEIMKEECLEYEMEYNESESKFHIIDINFAKTNMEQIRILFKMNKIRKEMKLVQQRKNKSKE